ncbi:MT-A70 family methyltransferase [Labrys neptuniae]
MTAVWPFGDLIPHHYRVAVFDFPWKFSAGTKSRPQHYRRMTFAEILALPVPDLLHPDGARALVWITAPLMNRAAELQKAWGLRYCSMLPWIKLWQSETGMFIYRDSVARGTGYEVQGNAEYVLIFKKGRPQSIKGNPFPGALISERREHSRKPDNFMHEIERRLDGPRADVFSRVTRPGWDGMGDELGKFDEVAA